MLDVIIKLRGRRLGVLGALFALGLTTLGCDRAHDDRAQEVMGEDCSACHLADYQGTSDPDHFEVNYSSFCGGCHYDTFWRPPFAPNLHPDEAFAIEGGPHNAAIFVCEECHDPALEDVPSALGQNTDCVGCHTGEHSRGRSDDQHEGVLDYPQGDAPPNFCLDCHPNGRNEF